MISKNIIFFLFLFPLIFSLKEPDIYLLEKDSSQKYYINNMTDNTLYLFSKNTISGTFTYDIDSPVALNLSFSKSASIDSNPSSLSFEEGHNENITNWKENEGYKYFFSIPVLISDDNKYTTIKIQCSDENKCIKEGENISVKLIGNYTWKIAVFVLCYFIFFIAAIFLTCYFARNCLTKCCNFRDN